LNAGKLFRPVRIGLLTPYFSFFDQRFPPSFRQSQEAYAAQLADALATPDTVVVPSGLVDSAAAAGAAEGVFRRERVDVMVVAPLMAAPPGFVAPMLAALERPVVIWLDDRAETIEEAISELDATRDSSFLGSIMLSSALRAAGVKHYVVATGSREGKLVVRAARGASVRTMLAGLRIGIVGEPLPGYADVLLVDQAASAVGVSIVHLDSNLFSASYVAGDSPSHSFWPAFAQHGVVTADAKPGLAASIALAGDLERIVERHDLAALVINCHSDQLRWHSERGVVGCLGASALTTAGVPVSCTGDVATAVALAVTTWLAGDTQYAEGYVIARRTGELLISSCGLANLGLREPSQPLEFHGNDLYPGARGNGCCVRMAFAAGPATILALGGNSATARPRFIWKTGFMSGRYYKAMKGPSGTFSFDPPGNRSVSTAWVEAGPSHHIAVTRGHLDVELLAAAAIVNAEFVQAGVDSKGNEA
jgi:L-arabinose isomerase